MPGQYDNTNRGALFKNDRKERDSQPDYTGKIEVDPTLLESLLSAAGRGNVVIFVSAWKKTIQKGDRTGQLMLSLSVQPPKKPDARDGAGAGPRDNSAGYQRPQRGPAPTRDEALGNTQQFKEDDIPF